MGHSHGGLQRIQIDDHLAGIDGVRIGLECLAGAVHPAVDILHGLFIHGEDPVFAAGLDGHVGDGEAVVHGQGGYALPGELQGLVQSAVHADPADQVEDDVLAADHGLELSLQHHLDGGGDLEPQQAGGHGGGHIRGADAGREGPQRSIGAGVGIGAYNDLAWGAQAFFRQKCVLHTHLAYIKEIGNLMLMSKVPGLETQLCRFDVLAGGIVVQDDGDLVPVKDPGEASLLKLGDGHRGGDVVAQHHIHPGLDELAHLHGIQPGVLGQDLLCHCHSHVKTLLSAIPLLASQYDRPLVKRM